MTANRFISNIMTRDVAGTRDFYIRLLDMHLHFDSDWFVILKPDQNSALELGIIDVSNDVVPEAFRATPAGSYLTFVVDDVDAVFERANSLGLNVIEAPGDMFYGQRRMLLTDPNALLIDVSSPTVRR